MRLRFTGWVAWLAAVLTIAAAAVSVSTSALAAVAAPAAGLPTGTPAKGPVSSSYSSPVTGYTVTLVARKCSSYTDIMANRARNNIMESLQDLGKDSVYQAGQGVNPATERDNDPGCTPLNGWQFELGSSFTKPGQLSVVTGSPLVITADTGTVPQLNAQGERTGKVLQGAVVEQVTDEQYQLAQESALWVQGGTVQYPQLNNRYGDEYAFGVLRCALDNANADNVESVTYPSGTKNVFCYAYYVNPAPAAATVTIRKEVTGSGVSQDFTFDSNLSYETSGTFSLPVANGQSASSDFIRADSASFGGPYNVKEEVPDGWKLTGLSCSDTNGMSTWITDQATASTSITLAAADHVTCTYTDSPPQSPTLTVWKVTSGGAGGPFRFAVVGPVSHNLTATTSAAERPAEATANGTSPTDYTPGTYTITEKLPPASRAGAWHFQQAYCNGHVLPGTVRGDSVSVNVMLLLNTGHACVFRNTFVPNGKIVIRLRTIGGTASGAFLGVGPGQSRYDVFKATTSRPAVPVTIYNKSHLEFGTWLAYSLTPKSSPARGTWVFQSFTCSRGTTTHPAAQVRVIRLSASSPAAACLATYRFQPATRIELVKTAGGLAAARSGPAVVQIQCLGTANGTVLARGQVVLARTATRAALPRPLVVQEPARCTVRETATGTASALNWTGSATLNGRKLPLPGTFTAGVPANPPLYLVTVHNDYHSAVVPCGIVAATRHQPDC